MEVTEIPLVVALPGSKPYKVRSIASTEEHLGNRIAEGSLHPSMFWPELARRERLSAQQKQAQSVWMRGEYQRLLDDFDERRYRAEWVSRWMEFHGDEAVDNQMPEQEPWK